MKNYYFLVILMSVAVCLTGCNDDEIMNRPVPQAGDEIAFGVSGKYEISSDSPKGKSRTIYGDLDNSGPNGAGTQEINWVSEDKVMIYSPDVQNVTTYVEYEVTPTIEAEGQSHGTLTKVNPDAAGLQWSGDGSHTFYAVYPGVSMLSSSYRRNFSFDRSKLTGYIPTTQGHRIQSNGDGSYTATCNMNYAHMIAKTITTPAESTDGVSLDFYPVVTAVDITLIAKNNVTLTAMNVRGISNGDETPVIAGQYSVDIANLNGTTVPDCQLVRSESDQNLITVPLYENYNASGEIPGEERRPIQLQAGKSIKLTVFLLPYQNLTGIQVSVSSANGPSKSADLQFSISPHKKSIVQLTLPSRFSGPNEWISNVDDNVLISQLSIPGTANSFSYLYNGDQKTQTADVTAQWNAGVRCFELRGPGASASSQLQCNRTNIGETFGNAVTSLIKLLADSPREFLMIMPAYDSDAGRGDVQNYFNQLNDYYGTLKSELSNKGLEFITYNPNLTVGEARGKVMFIARITSEEDDDRLIARLGALDQGVNIAQWGSLKDYWGRRGYKIHDLPAKNWAEEYTAGGSNWWGGGVQQGEVEYYMMNNNTTNGQSSSIFDSSVNAPSDYSHNVEVPDKKPVDPESESFVADLAAWEGLVDYEHTSYRAGENSGIAFVQDWQRVVPRNAAGNYRMRTYTSWSVDYTDWCYWGESYSEKQADVWNTFMLCMQEHGGKIGNRFFINSMDGYYVTSDIDKSYKPYIQSNPPYSPEGAGFSLGGTQGDIASYAADINQWFYGRLLTLGFENMSGPVNIIILDRVLPNGLEGNEPGDLLPQVIVDNNFKFPLLTRGGGTNENPSTQNQADASYSNGGNVWK